MQLMSELIQTETEHFMKEIRVKHKCPNMDPYTARAVTAQRWWWGGVNAITLILHYLLERLKYDPNNLSLTMCWKVINVFLFSR